MPNEVPLQSGIPHQSFSVTLGDYTLEMYFYWVTRFDFFRVDIYDITEGKAPITLGRVAHAGVNLLSGLSDYGTLAMEGDAPTPNNIGIASRLMWEAPSG